MIDNLLSLSLLLHANKGVYALLLGSGISRPAGIPTGWEVTLDLVQKLAHLQNQAPAPDLEKWFVEKYGEGPDYSILLESLAKTSTERTRLLRSYFEPNQEEKEQGLKVPTKAHHAIASLVSMGVIKVIITTNFDRLLEQALAEAGINPAVISTADAVKGALPLAHSPCTIIKLHGDYLDTRLKNTTNELSIYNEDINTMLDQVFDEYGLIICGWSASYDVGLRNALERQVNRRFTTYWTSLGEVGQEAEQLIARRSAELVQIAGADEFFTQLLENLRSLDKIRRAHPVSIELAVAQVKRYIVQNDPIGVHDILMEETKSVYSQLHNDFSVEGSSGVGPSIKNYIENYEALSEKLAALISTVAYWGDDRCISAILKALEWLGSPPDGERGGTWIDIRRYPALMLIYAAGISLTARKNLIGLHRLLFEPKNHHTHYRKSDKLILELHPYQVIDQSHLNAALGKNFHVPMSERMLEKLSKTLAFLFPTKEAFSQVFDDFEYCFSLSFGKIYSSIEDRFWGPVGRFVYLKSGDDKLVVLERVKVEFSKEGFQVLLGEGPEESLKTVQGYNEFIYDVARSHRYG
jgi:hypothetical protein